MILLELLTIPLSMFNKNWWFLNFQKEFLNFSFCIRKLAVAFYMINEIQPKIKCQNIVQCPFKCLWRLFWISKWPPHQNGTGIDNKNTDRTREGLYLISRPTPVPCARDSVTRACTDSRARKPLQLRDKSVTLSRAWVVIVRHLDYILFTRAGDGRWPRYQAKSLACPGCGHRFWDLRAYICGSIRTSSFLLQISHRGCMDVRWTSPVVNRRKSLITVDPLHPVTKNYMSSFDFNHVYVNTHHLWSHYFLRQDISTGVIFLQFKLALFATFSY